VCPDLRAFSPGRRSNRSVRFARRRSCRRIRCNRLKARANEWKSGSVNSSRCPSRRTTIKKYRSERKGRRSFDTGIECGKVAIRATVRTRTAKPAVRATCYWLPLSSQENSTLVPAR
jgi:hypothetical protein